MGSLLLDDQPLVIQPSLATLIGLNEAIFLQQLHYWLQKSTHRYDGRAWVYNTYQGWQEQFPFWGVNTIRRIIEKLEQTGVILTGNYNQSKIDKTKWYSIDYDKLEELTTAQNGQIDCEKSQTTAQSGQMDSPKWADELPKMGRPIPEITTETTTEKEDEEEEARANKPNPFLTYEQNIGVITPVIAEDISQWLDGGFFDEPHEIVTEAIKTAVRNGARKWNYANKALIDWTNRGLRTLQQVMAYQVEFEQRAGGVAKHAKGSDIGGRTDQEVRATPITRGKTGWINRPDPKDI
ncbi:DnaD/phage-associated family protein [Brevibacillus aydinogluensis]|uniref:DnaD domain-containing protein n=1 Tax=Brevibacillus aydinogluensis TaxID=927786 RepID=UPI0028937A37|nr:DnaD domain protein [Brevibacillus aydinogluensis]MDT3416145.1 DnaD/phage-associated family protein [Brevibacillus aydinogluensis]